MTEETAAAIRALAANHPETIPFWEAAAEGRFVLATCRACGKAHWYPRATCPMCGSPEIGFQPASGHGTIYSVSVARRADPPYALAYVTLAEGPTMMTNIVACDLDALAIGQPVRVIFQAGPTGLPIPMFTPDRGSAG